MSTRIQLRRGGAAQWTATNPVLADGEPGLERDTHKVKVGDGLTPWTGLPYAVDPTAVLAAAGYTDTAVAGEAAARQAADALLVPLTQRGAANGVATLDSGGRVPSAQIPALSWTRAHAVANQAAMLALTGVVAGEDIAIRQDGAGTFLLTGADPTQLTSWTLLAAPTDAVTTVNGHNGNVVLAAPDVGADPAGTNIPLTQKGAVNGVASLDGTGKVPAAQIPGGGGAETIETFAASGAAITLGNPLTTGTMKDVTLTASCTITLPAPAAGVSFLVRLTQDATGGRTVTFVLPAGGSPKWGASGVPPALTATANAQDEIAFHSWTGTTWTGGLANKDIR